MPARARRRSSPAVPVDPAHRRALLEAKLRGLVRSRWGAVADDLKTDLFPGGAAGVAGGEAYVLAEDQPGRSLGAALAWGRRRDASAVHLLAGGGAPDLARRAQHFRLPVEVLSVSGTELAEVAPEPLAPEPPVPAGARVLRPLLEQAGAEPVEEHGLLVGEVRGLEVARVVEREPGEWRLEIGVGKHDREAHREVLDRDPGVEDLFRVVRQVLEFRAPGSEGHAAYQLAPERWLRWVVVQRPDLIGASELRLVPAPVERHDLRHLAPAPCRDHDRLFVCSVGVDLDLVPAAVDAWLAAGDEPELVLVVPEGDDHRVTRDLVDDLRIPARITTVSREWRSLHPRTTWDGGE